MPPSATGQHSRCSSIFLLHPSSSSRLSSIRIGSGSSLFCSMAHPFATMLYPFWYTFLPNVIPLKNPFLIHHPIFLSLLAPLIVPDTQYHHIYIPPLFHVQPSILLCSSLLLLPYFLISSSPPTCLSPPLSFFCVLFIYCLLCILFGIFCIPVFSFHPSSQTHYLVPTPSFNLSFFIAPVNLPSSGSHLQS